MELWVDKYRPQRMADYVWTDPKTEALVGGMVSSGATDNLLLWGPPGVGKTSLAVVLMNELGVDRGNQLWLNASREGSIETMRTRVNSYITSGGWGGMKYVILDEADGLSAKAQDSLKADIEEYSNGVRWILMCNTPSKIIGPLVDRCTEIAVKKPDIASFEARMLQILISEGIDVGEAEVPALDAIVKKNYPSLRKCIRDLQRYTASGKLEDPAKGSDSDWMYKAMDMMKKGQIKEARALICTNATVDEMEELFRWIYERSDELFGPSADDSVLVVADHLHKHVTSADPEINFSAMMVKLSKLS